MLPQYTTYMNGINNKHTADSYRAAIEPMLKNFGVEKVEDMGNITLSMAREYRDKMLNSGIKISTINARMRPLVVFVYWLIENGHLPQDTQNVFAKIKALKEPRPVINYLSLEEQKALIAATSEGSQERLMIVFLLCTGLRRNELVNVKIDDIVDGSLIVRVTKGDKERIVPLPDYLVEMIFDYIKKRSRMNKSPYLFTSKRRGETLTGEAVRVRIKMICDKAGVREIPPHVLRHTYATNLVSGGTNINVISSLLGHSSVQVTERRYAAVTNEVKTSAVATLPKLV